MNNWLNNIKGQITELASEVLQEATEEVDDPETELQVERKKCAEAERQLVVEKSKTEALQKKINELEEQLYSANLENDATREKFEHMVYERDAHIKKLQIKIEQSRFHQHDDEFQATSFQTIDLAGEEDRLAHAEYSSKPSISATNLDASTSKHAKKIAQLKEKHEQEIQALMAVNAENVRHLRGEYEARINELQSWGADLPLFNVESAEVHSKVTDNTELNDKCQRLKLLLEERVQQIEMLQREIHSRDNAIEQLNTKLEKEGSKNEAEEVVVQTVQCNQEVERLKSVNNELMSAYNELNKEFEEHKSKNTSIAVTNADLVARIEALKATLIEYEENYEMCKSDHNETAGQLTKLTAEFDRLRNNFHTSKAVSESNEEKLNSEIEILRTSLQQAKVDRDQLHSDISHFKGSFKSIDDELNLLRDNNRRLMQENMELSESVARYESLRDMLNKSNKELGEFHERFTAMQKEHSAQVNLLTQEKEQLQCQLENMHEKLGANLLDVESQTEGIEIVALSTTTLNQITQQQINDEEQQQKDAPTKKVHSLKRHPSCDEDSASAGSNSGWERMGGEWVGNETIASTGVSSSNCSGSNSGKCRRGEDSLNAPVEEGEAHTTSQQSSPKGSSAVDSMAHSEGDVEEVDTHHKMDEAANLLIDSLRQRQVQIEAEMQETSVVLQERTLELAHQQQLYHQLLEVSEARADELNKSNQEMQEFRIRLESDSSTIQELQQRAQQLMKEKLIEKQQLEETVLQLNESITACQLLRSANCKLEQEKHKLEEAFEAMKDEHQKKASQLETLNSDSNLSNIQLEEAKQYSASLEKELSALRQKMEQQTSKQQLLEKDIEQLARLTTENEELKKILGEKHAESQAYYDKIQEFSELNQMVEKKLKTAENELIENQQRLVMSQETQERMHKELSRLREHLLTIEEMSTNEAMAAEERETELRHEIRLLQDKTSSISSTVAQSETQNQEEIASLQAQLSTSQVQAVELRSQLLDREKSLVEVTKALSNLQNVLKELAEEHLQEITQFEKELEIAKRERENTFKQLLDLQQKQSQLVEDRRFLEDTVTLLKDDLIRKSGLVEELENQMEELRHAQSRPSASFANNTYKIDDATLKQLFLSYLLAERNKQPEIAVVMASILGYSQEEQSSIRQAVSIQDQSSSWFSIGGRRSAGGRPTSQEPSLTEQFVRFLEKESAAIQQQTALPVQSGPSGNSGISLGDPPAKGPGYSSSIDLKHILES